MWIWKVFTFSIVNKKSQEFDSHTQKYIYLRLCKTFHITFLIYSLNTQTHTRASLFSIPFHCVCVFVWSQSWQIEYLVWAETEKETKRKWKLYCNIWSSWESLKQIVRIYVFVEIWAKKKDGKWLKFFFVVVEWMEKCVSVFAKCWNKMKKNLK